MRQPTNVLRYLVILLALSFASRAYADDRSEARAHYQTAVKYYSGGDYRSAIREFSAAQQLVPADLNNYNLALCYDKLGDAEPAIQYYRAFLDKQPNTDKRGEIEASINRLEAASRSAASKKADEARRADDARRADEARKADDAQRPAGPVLGPAPAPSSGPSIGPSSGPPIGPPIGPSIGPSGRPSDATGPAAGPVLGPAPAPPAEAHKPPRTGPAIAGSIGTPSSGAPVSTGDQQLDRVSSINIDEIRDQRMGGGAPDGRGGPGGAANAGPAQPGQPGQAAPPAPNPAMNGQPLAGNDEPIKETPVYKKWWFWVVVGVSAVVVYEVASTPNTSSNTGRAVPPTGRPPQPGGLTLLRW
jgi:hypothetical protein